MGKPRKTIFFGIALLALLAIPSVALADNCGSYFDCYSTARAATAAATGVAVALMIISLGLDLVGFIPHPIARAVSMAKGLIEGALGYDPITGQPFGKWERALGAMPWDKAGKFLRSLDTPTGRALGGLSDVMDKGMTGHSIMSASTQIMGRIYSDLQIPQAHAMGPGMPTLPHTHPLYPKYPGPIASGYEKPSLPSALSAGPARQPSAVPPTAEYQDITAKPAAVTAAPSVSAKPSNIGSDLIEGVKEIIEALKDPVKKIFKKLKFW